MIARRDDGALLARLGDGECAVVIDGDGVRMWATSVMSALSHGNWENDASELDDKRQREGARVIEQRVADGLLDCDGLAELASGKPGASSPGLPGIRPQ